MKTAILGQAYELRSPNAAAARMVNLYPEIVPEGGKEPAYLQRCPGLRYLASYNSGPVRGLWAFGGYGYAVTGEELWRFDSAFSGTLVGKVYGEGPVSMADNGTQLFIATSDESYIYNATTRKFGPITDPDFPGAVTVGFLDGYFAFNAPDSQQIWVTSLLDGTSIDPLDFASAEGNPDNVVGLIVDHREVWIFGTNTVEVWYDEGGTNFPLARIQGAFNEIGCAAAFSIAKLDNGIFWLGSDARGRGIVYRANGYTGLRISTHAVEWQIQSYGDISDAIAYTYQQDGHSFYVLTFPSAGATWVYDVATNSWHERAAWVNDKFTRHRSNCQVAFANQIVVGDYANGSLYALDPEVYDDDGEVQKWLRSWRALPQGQNNLKRTAHHSLQLDCQAGVGLVTLSEDDCTVLATDSGWLITDSGNWLYASDHFPTADPQVMLRWSDDGGHTWSNEHWRSMGRMGDYGYRTLWRRLGMTTKLRDRVYEVSGVDPVRVAIMGAELILSPTNA